jgi:hypothetical protein
MSQLLVAMASLLVLQFGTSQRADVVNALSSALADKYVDEAVGKRVAKLLRAKLERGEFDGLAHPEAFAAALTDVLQQETRDRHLWIFVREVRTGGGGHSVDGFPLLPHGFQMLLPVARNIDPRSGKGWEGEGIKPDVEVNPEQALQAAIGHFYGWRQ